MMALWRLRHQNSARGAGASPSGGFTSLAALAINKSPVSAVDPIQRVEQTIAELLRDQTALQFLAA